LNTYEYIRTVRWQLFELQTQYYNKL